MKSMCKINMYINFFFHLKQFQNFDSKRNQEDESSFIDNLL